MNERWKKTWKERMLQCDKVDLMTILESKGPTEKRQFAAEWSQSSYMKMLRDEYAITDYLSKPSQSLGVTP